ncbi:helix-turn-helix domain-containing protein [Paenibacillus sp. FSL W7-1287]|uniref:helix-turn-helix domain-containing protein n=1 Tax=Paenibacillus sp. FSL W7-1287 TaxID=2954538 RepID=UPI0030F7F451
MKRLPMMLQLVFILFCVMLIPTTIITWYSGTQILGYSEKAIAESSLDSLESNRELNENALNYIAQDTIRLASSNIFDRLRHYKTYEQLNQNYTNVEIGLSLLKDLQRLIRSNEGIYSAFFYLQDADYIVSSDKGITMLERYESLKWIDEALLQKDGISGVWTPRMLADNEMVFSYILPLNRLSTSTKGMLVVNLKESQIAQYMDASNQKDSSYYLIDLKEQSIISHNDKSALLTDVTQIPIISEMIKTGAAQGYQFNEVDGKRLLYTWNTSNLNDWLYIHSYSMDTLMSQTRSVQHGMIIFSIVIFLVGSVLAVLLATWLSKPLRELTKHIRARNISSAAGKNELDFLGSAFRKMQDEEEKLTLLIKEQEQDSYSLAIHQLLQGEALDRKKKELLLEMLPERNYHISVAALDQYSQYINKTSPETRSYHFYLFIAQIEKLSSSRIRIRSVNYGEGRFAIVMNYHTAEQEELLSSLHNIQAAALENFGHTVTIGISDTVEALSDVSSQLLQALELVKHRMIEGNGRLIFSKQQLRVNNKYIYPSNSERRIVNYIDTGDLSSITEELDLIRKQIEAATYISYDNILFIYNQLFGVMIKHLNEKSINTSAIFANRGNIYSVMASMETLDELDVYFKQLFAEVSMYVDQSCHEVGYLEKIFAYLDEHYKEDIVFEDMAKEIGISYSYMRKIVYELTGKSLMECINQKRIQKAKQLLVKTTLNVAQIAAEVGYNNIQSFNRFFRKFEGITPSSYKASKLNG